MVTTNNETMNHPINNDRHVYCDPDDIDTDDKLEEALDRADYLRDCLRDGQAERMANRPQDGRICDCEDAPCCGHYEI